MFSLQDFPVGSYLYWVRRVSYNNVSQIVYSRYQVTEHDSDGNLLSDVEPDNNIQFGQPNEIIRVKQKQSYGFTIIHSKDKYLNYNPHNMIIPEVLFDIYHNPDNLPNTPLSELQKLLGSGLGPIDELIKQATISFEEWNKDKGNKQVVKLKELNLKPGAEALIVDPFKKL